MSITKDQIIAALKKLGPVSPGELADHLEVEQSALGYHVKKMLDAGELKAAGKTSGRRIALPDQKFEEGDATPQEQRRPKKKAKRKASAPRRAAPAPRPAVVQTAPMAAITTDFRIVIFNDQGAPAVLSEAQSEKVAELCHQFFKE